MVGIRCENARSDDSGDQSTPSASSVTIEEWVSAKDAFRVVAHGFPIIGRVRTRSQDPGLNECYQKHVAPRIPGILTKYSVSYSTIRLSCTRPKYEHQNDQHVILIHSEDTNTRAWPAAAREIFHLFRTHDTGDHNTELQVEIKNPDRAYNDVSRIIPHNPPLIEALKQVEPDVTKAVGELMGSSWSSIAFHTRVHRYAAGANVSGKTTIIIFCSPGSTCNYDKAEDELLKILKAIPFEIHLELLPGEITQSEMPQDSDPINHSTAPEKPVSGSSISVEGNTTAAGTLGGWVVLNLPKEKRTIHCILTCYHVIRSPDKEVATNTDEHGVVLDNKKGHVVVEYPAAYDAKFTLSELGRICALNPNDTEGSKHRDTLSSRFSNPGIGRVILASGDRLTNGYRSDWALVESPSTFSSNRPVPNSAIFPRWAPPPNRSYLQNEDSKIRAFGRVRYGDWVAKRGRTTGCSTGEINNMERVVQWRGQTTKEVEILSNRDDFARPGDSGSMVTGDRGELLGLVHGIDQHTGFDVALMTRIDRIQEDVERLTNGGFISLD